MDTIRELKEITMRKKILICGLAILLLTSITAWAIQGKAKANKSNYRGYVMDSNNHILYKLDLPFNKEHKLNLKAGEKFVFVANRNVLNNTKCYQPPEAKEDKRVRLINKRKDKILERQAIAELKQEGVIE